MLLFLHPAILMDNVRVFIISAKFYWNCRKKLSFNWYLMVAGLRTVFFGTYLEILANQFLIFLRPRILSHLLASYPSACEKISRPTNYKTRLTWTNWQIWCKVYGNGNSISLSSLCKWPSNLIVDVLSFILFWDRKWCEVTGMIRDSLIGSYVRYPNIPKYHVSLSPFDWLRCGMISHT